MNKISKIAIIIVIIGATIAGLAFYATRSKTKVVEETPKTAIENPAPKAPQTVSNGDQLPPLPADNKQAISNEIKGINDSIKSVDDALSADTGDDELGL